MPNEKKTVPILMYHSISYSANTRFHQFTVSPASFAQQMAYLHQQGYTPITVTQLIRARSQRLNTLPARPIVLTFDDGFADFFSDALPVLKQHNFAATLYVTTAFIDGMSLWLRHERETTRPMLTWKQLVAISSNGIECGAHTHSHPQLDTLTYSAAHNEIILSKRLLEDHLDREISSFAYPFGYYTSRVRQLVQEAGYTSACAVRHKLSTENEHPFSLARQMVDADLSIEEFAALITGRSSSPAKEIHKLYAQARTPVWQFARCCSASVKRHLHEKGLAS